MLLLISLLFKYYKILFAATNKDNREEIVFYYISSILCYLLNNKERLGIEVDKQSFIYEMFLQLMKTQNRGLNLFKNSKKKLIKENTSTLKRYERYTSFSKCNEFKKFMHVSENSIEYSTVFFQLYQMVNRNVMQQQEYSLNSKLKELYRNVITNERIFDIMNYINYTKKNQNKDREVVMDMEQCDEQQNNAWINDYYRSDYVQKVEYQLGYNVVVKELKEFRKKQKVDQSDLIRFSKLIFKYLDRFQKDLMVECLPKLKKQKNYEMMRIQENNDDGLNLDFYHTKHDFYNDCYDSVHIQIKKYIKKQEQERFKQKKLWKVLQKIVGYQFSVFQGPESNVEKHQFVRYKQRNIEDYCRRKMFIKVDKMKVEVQYYTNEKKAQMEANCCNFQEMQDKLKTVANKEKKQESMSSNSNNNPNYANVVIQNMSSNEQDQLFMSIRKSNNQQQTYMIDSFKEQKKSSVSMLKSILRKDPVYMNMKNINLLKENNIFGYCQKQEIHQEEVAKQNSDDDSDEYESQRDSYCFKCEMMNEEDCYFGKLYIQEKDVVFESNWKMRRPDSGDYHRGVKQLSIGNKYKIYKISQIWMVLPRTYIYIENSIEIFLITGKVVFLNFYNHDCQQKVIGVLEKRVTDYNSKQMKNKGKYQLVDMRNAGQIMANEREHNKFKFLERIGSRANEMIETTQFTQESVANIDNMMSDHLYPNMDSQGLNARKINELNDKSSKLMIFRDRKTAFEQLDIYNKWTNNQMGNFEYIMWLNTISGRGHNDISQYMIFPWVLKKYDHENLDLEDCNNYRDLKQPIGAMDQERLEGFKQRQEDYDSCNIDSEQESFLYGSHYSGPGLLTYFLIRMEPFSYLGHKLQKDRFDYPDRMFYDVNQAWLNCSKISTSDVKELIPQFYYCPEFLSNISDLDLGRNQENQDISTVVLPKWAKNKEEFIFKMRQSLEYKKVQENLQNWVDLIWGYKQNPQIAQKYNNLFYFSTYKNKVVHKLKEYEKKEEWDAYNGLRELVQSYGQTPEQLFTKNIQKKKKKQVQIQYFSNSKQKYNLNIMQILETNRIISQVIASHEYYILVVENKEIIFYDKQVSNQQRIQQFCDLDMQQLDDKIIDIRKINISKENTANIHRLICYIGEYRLTVIGGYQDGSFKVFRKGKQVGSYLYHFDKITQISYSSVYKLLIVSSNDFRLSVYKISQTHQKYVLLLKQEFIIYGHNNQVPFFQIDDQLGIIVSYDLDGLFIISQIRTGKILQTYQVLYLRGNISLIQKEEYSESQEQQNIVLEQDDQVVQFSLNQNGYLLIATKSGILHFVRFTHQFQVIKKFNYQQQYNSKIVKLSFLNNFTPYFLLQDEKKIMLMNMFDFEETKEIVNKDDPNFKYLGNYQIKQYCSDIQKGNIILTLSNPSKKQGDQHKETKIFEINDDKQKSFYIDQKLKQLGFQF